MSKIWDEREKSLEEEYFRKKEQELIEKLRAKRAEQEQRKKTDGSPVHCPKCGDALVRLTYEDVRFDRCPSCNGVWLEARELEQLTRQPENHGWLSRMWRSLSAIGPD
jgi:uncharacterized protein